MTSPHIAIAKASLAAALFRADVTVLNRDSIAEFHKLLENSISVCSASNVQKCKDWLLKNVVPSSTRTSALGKYLASLAKYLQHDVKRETDGQSEQYKPSASRKRLHIVYLLNDLLHHTKYHSQNASIFSTFSSSLQPFLLDLIQSTVPDCKPKVRDRLFEVLSVWKVENYYPADYTTKLRGAFDNVKSSGISKPLNIDVKAPEPAKYAKEVPFVMPSTHGDPSIPYFDLPAGNLMPHILPNSSAAIRPDQVRALQFIPGPADDGLVHALKYFLKEVDNINDYTPSNVSAVVTEVDDLGQLSYQDENGEVVSGDSYYGWSRAFCEKMKKRRESNSGREARVRSYSSSRSPSWSPSRSPRKRRHYSGSVSSRSASRSRSGRSRERSNSYGEDPLHRRASHNHRKRSGSRSYTPEEANPLPVPPPPPSQTNSERGEFASRFSSSTSAKNHPPPFNMLPNQIAFPPPLGPGGLPLPPPPPPPPPNYLGPWPPNIGFPSGLPLSAASTQQGSTFATRTGPPAPNQSWSHGNWQGNP